jgi:multidrug resistance efflux pump
MRRFLWGSVKGLAVLGLLVLTMLWLSGAFVDKVEPGPPHPRPKPPSLTTGTVERRAFPLLMEQVGTLRTQNEAHVSSRIMAQVREILVREGDTVMGPEGAAGGATILARLDDRDIQARLHQAQSQQRATERGMEAAKARMEATRAQVEAAKARLDQASSDYRRYEELHKSQAATGQQLEHARAQKDVAEAQARAAMQDVAAAQGEIHRIQAQRTEAEAGVTDANVMLSHTVIHAPITGRLMKKMTDVGEMVSPGRPLFILETPGQPELHAIVSESILPHVRPGQTLETRIDSLDVVLQGVVREIAPKADPATRTALVKVSLPPMPGLVSGLFGRIWVPQGEYHSLVVPRSAVREVGQLTLVDVLDAQGYPQRRFVTLGNRHGEMVEVLSGLQEGEEVVIP